MPRAWRVALRCMSASRSPRVPLSALDSAATSTSSSVSRCFCLLLRTGARVRVGVGFQYQDLRVCAAQLQHKCMREQMSLCLLTTTRSSRSLCVKSNMCQSRTTKAQASRQP